MKQSQTDSTKKTRWNAIAEKAGNVADKTGKVIDKKILDLVIALAANSINTKASCEGHLDHGIAAPWVDIGLAESSEISKKIESLKALWLEIKTKAEKTQKETIDKMWLESKKLELEIKYPTSLLVQKLSKLLDKFYQKRTSSYDTHIILRQLGLTSYRMECQGTIFQEVRGPSEKEIKLKQYQEEMKSFYEFLKNIFFKI